MKKILLAIACAIMVVAVSAQEDGGKKFVVSGTFGINTSSETYAFDGTKYAANAANAANATPTNVTFTIMPTFGYQFNQKFMAGVSLGYARSTNTRKAYNPLDPEKLATTNKTTTDAFVVGVWGRYNLLTLNKLTVFAELGANFVFGSTDSINTIENPKIERTLADNTIFAFNATLVPGLNYAFSESFSMDFYLNVLGLSYEIRENTNHMVAAAGKYKDEVVTTHEFGLKCNLQHQANNIDAFTSAVTIGFNYHF